MFPHFRFRLGKSLGIVAAAAVLGKASIYCYNESAFSVEPTSSNKYKVKLDTEHNSFRLLGLGIRQVTFLSINVYSVAFYADNSTIERIKQNSRWVQEFSKSKFLNLGGEAKFFIQDIVRQSKELAIVIKPTRPTDGSHLANGFQKFLMDRLKKETGLSDSAKKEFKSALQDFRDCFPKFKILPGVSIMFRKQDSALKITLDGAELGCITNAELSNWFFEAYLGYNQISPSLVANFATNIEEMLG